MIKIRVVTPLGQYLGLDVKSIHVKSVEGEMTILPKHMPLVAALVPCRLKLTDESGKELEYAISGGFIHFGNDEALLLTDAIEGKNEIDLERAKKAYERARARIDKKDEHTNLKRAQLSLQRAINRISVHG
ncbi:ATP synthase F1, epsilon subunit [Firmicutes bacterium M10-2]|nr:ATP synthase F1, epsilon subunit [Firmicutes bacterium M10-2]